MPAVLAPNEVPGAPSPRYAADAMVSARPLVIAHQQEKLVVFGTTGGIVYGYSLAGEVRWQTPVVGPITKHPLALPEGRVAFICDDDHVRVVDGPSGRIVWDYSHDSGLGEAMLLRGDELVVNGSNGQVFTLDLDSGKSRAPLFTDSGGREPAVVLGPKGMLLVGSSDGQVTALQAGETLWKVNLGRSVSGRQRLTVIKGQLLVWAGGRDLIRLELTQGRVTWLGRFAQEGEVVSRLLPLEDGVLLATNRNLLYYFSLPEETK